MKLAAAYLRGVSFSRRAPSGWAPPGPSGWPRGHSTGRKPHLVTPVFLRAEAHLGRLAVVDQHGRFTYDDLLHYSSLLSKKIGDLCCRSRGEDRDIDGARVAFLCGNDVSYVVAKWAVWMAGGVAVPLSRAHPPGDLEYLVEDSRSSVVVAAEELKDLVRGAADRLQLPLVVLSETDYTADYDGSQNSWFRTSPVTAARGRRPKRAKNRFDDLLVTNRFKHRGALIVYTSGTTGRPKGVLLTHGNLHAQVEAMVVAWGWSRNDVILHVLPLHHIHGIVNVLMTPLHCGATCVMLPKFEPKKVWSFLLNPVNMEDRLRINLFMAVPTIYAKLIENIEAHLKRGRGSRYAKAYVKSACQSRIRLMVSGSSSLPQPVMERWEDITGHRLLERYGMTEIGMALTNPLKGQRTPGAVGNPMPWMEVCIARPNVYAPNGYDVITKGSMRGTSVTPGLEGEQGELMVRGPSVFKEYWNKPEATKAAFTKDGWFKTGDTVLYEDGIYKIMGRTSVDIIKSGGYKISALNIERHLLVHPLITDCAVVGLSDITWGQRVAAAVVLKGGSQLSLEQLRRWAQERLPSYQLPTVLKCLNTLPRNAMGKVNKEDILAEVFPEFLRSLI